MRNGQGERSPAFILSCLRDMVWLKNNLKKALKERNEAKCFDEKNRYFPFLEPTNGKHRKE